MKDNRIIPDPVQSDFETWILFAVALALLIVWAVLP